ncbi:hypothetical protein AVEN_200157-1 [Araneus ventricosus]|uniref:Uncharacterized protein n=1 Tax=Araneus ventricosus TaxID=182803 RepID=A0A4Y2SKF7_ARAVE|nr:hypothetical protein AVEN_239535-1 [Araneus ventricosus]GBN87788.1 hypothetical protein AVEN_200157-1 [Araneus ventricosus]
MLGDGVILLHDNTHTARKTQALACWVVASSSCMTIPILLAKLNNYCESSSGKSGANPYSPDSAPNLGSKHLSGTRFSSRSDVKTVVENWLNGQDVISAKPD